MRHVFYNWETKYGMVILGGNMEEVSTGLLYLRLFSYNMPVKVKDADESLKIVKLRLKNKK